MNGRLLDRDFYQLDREFIARVRSASLQELRLMRRQYAGIGPDWKMVCIGRALVRRVGR